MNSTLAIRHELRPGDLGRIVSLHGKFYHARDGFGLPFEAFVGRTLAEFVLDNKGNGKFWLVERDGKLVACTAAVLRDNHRGQIRWVLVDPAERGQGLGKQLVNEAIRFCKEESCQSIFLETTDGLQESQALYESLGFKVSSIEKEELWDGVRTLIVMQKDLA